MGKDLTSDDDFQTTGRLLEKGLQNKSLLDLTQSSTQNQKNCLLLQSVGADANVFSVLPLRSCSLQRQFATDEWQISCTS